MQAMISAGMPPRRWSGHWPRGLVCAVLGGAVLCAQAQSDANPGTNAVTGVLRGVTNLFSKPGAPRPVSTATSTIGIRGLGAEDLAQAQPNLEAVGQMEALRQSESQAREFAGQASLVPVRVDPLPAPARSTSTSGQMP